jgi:glyoxylase-like metal-dependent hydrolase (beta-lactamase superfamily II)
VYAAVRTEPLSLAMNANSLIVVRESDVVVVDAQFTRRATTETIAAIRSVTTKAVRYVINTHWHDDHVAGNQVYRDSFPNVRFVMHVNTAADLATIGAQNRQNQVRGAPPVAERFERLLAMGLGIDSTAASPAERTALSSAIRIVRDYLAEAPGFHAIAADDTVDRRLTLPGTPRVDVLWFGRANTRGDLVVRLPEQRIVATGDLLVAPVPMAFGSYPSEWVAVLDSIAALQPAVLIPGHGPVMRSPEFVTRVRRMLARVRDEVSIAAARGDSIDVVRRSVTLDDDRRAIAGDEKWLNYLFRTFFLGPVVQRAYDQAR